jgi:hypothetical protein
MHESSKGARARRRLIKAIGVTASSTALMSSGSAVFAHQFLTEAPIMAVPDMEYSPRLQMMVKPGSEEPVFGYSRHQMRGNGEYKVAPLVTRVSTSSNCAVTPGGGPNGPGPRSDCDSDTKND